MDGVGVGQPLPLPPDRRAAAGHRLPARRRPHRQRRALPAPRRLCGRLLRLPRDPDRADRRGGAGNAGVQPAAQPAVHAAPRLRLPQAAHAPGALVRALPGDGRRPRAHRLVHRLPALRLRGALRGGGARAGADQHGAAARVDPRHARAQARPRRALTRVAQPHAQGRAAADTIEQVDGRRKAAARRQRRRVRRRVATPEWHPAREIRLVRARLLLSDSALAAERAERTDISSPQERTRGFVRC
mmetsp:Transcript_39180/g.114432  ORF Transcript_39180/g.114432 Transcript_39180/m.114432 type:complete len:244 (+) Transcript_39180:604-1335(+)